MGGTQVATPKQPIVFTHPFADRVGNNRAPIGMHIATIQDIRDEARVLRRKFGGAGTEEVDTTCFLFRFWGDRGEVHRVASKRMKISGDTRSTLFAFLSSLLGHPPPFGWDYRRLKGRRCWLTVEHVQRRFGTGVYAAIKTIGPFPAALVSSTPAVAAATTVAAPRICRTSDLYRTGPDVDQAADRREVEALREARPNDAEQSRGHQHADE